MTETIGLLEGYGDHPFDPALCMVPVECLNQALQEIRGGIDQSVEHHPMWIAMPPLTKCLSACALSF